MSVCGGGQGGGRPDRKGAGGVREAGEEEVVSRIPKATRAGEIGGNYATLHTISQSKKRRVGGGGGQQI